MISFVHEGLIAKRAKLGFAPFDDLHAAVSATVVKKVERFLFIVREAEGMVSQYAGHSINIIQLFARRSLFFLGGQLVTIKPILEGSEVDNPVCLFLHDIIDLDTYN